MATSQVETVSTGADKIKLAAVVALVVASVAGFYLLSKQGPIAQWGALVVGLIAAAGVFLVSEPGRQFVAFAKDDRLRVRLCGGDGAVSVAHGQDAGMGLV